MGVFVCVHAMKLKNHLQLNNYMLDTASDFTHTVTIVILILELLWANQQIILQQMYSPIVYACIFCIVSCDFYML